MASHQQSTNTNLQGGAEVFFPIILSQTEQIPLIMDRQD